MEAAQALTCWPGCRESRQSNSGGGRSIAARLRKLEKQLNSSRPAGSVRHATRRETEELGQELLGAADLAETYADIRNASPAYRLAVAKDLTPVTWRNCGNGWRPQRILLEYLSGDERGYVLVIPADGQPRLEQIAVSVEQARQSGHRARSCDRRHDRTISW